MKINTRKLALCAALSACATATNAALLEEVVVTAQKRSENLQDVPISITAISGEVIQDAAIRSFNDLGAYVPNFSVSENAVNTTISMRGISVGAQQSFEQSVGIFVDGIHYGKSRQARLGLFDLEQVEVLRGPQGILFGKNTLAGAVNVRSAGPGVGQETSGRVAVTAETDDGVIVEGFIATGLGDNMGVRFSFLDRSVDGYNNNSAPNAARPNMPTTDEKIYRLGLDWELSDQTMVKARYTYSDYLRKGSTGTITTFSPNTYAGPADTLMYGIMQAVWVPQGFSESVTDAFRDGYSFGGNALDGITDPNAEERLDGTDTQNNEFSLNIEHEMGNGITFASVTGYSDYKYKDGIDADFFPVSFIGRSDNSTYEQFSQELRFSSSNEGPFNWIGGLNYITSEQEIDRLVAIDGTLGSPAVLTQQLGVPTFLAFGPDDLTAAGIPQAAWGGILGVEGVGMFSQVGRLSNWKQDTESWAVFLQGTFDISDTLSITAGLRYTEETKEAYAVTDITTTASGLANPVAPPPSALELAANPALQLDPTFIPRSLLHGLQAELFDTYAHEFIEERDTSQVTPALILNWNPSDDHMYYASYSEGFKSGGFNSVDDQNPAFDDNGPIRNVPGVGFEYEDETAWSFEIGGKHKLLDGAMTFNWNVFNSEYDDQQVSTFVGLGFVVANAAKASIRGIEIDTLWQATDRLRLGLSLGLLDGEYDNFPGAGCTAAQQSALRELRDNDFPGGVTNALGCQQKFLSDGVGEFGTPSGESQNLAGGKLGADFSGSATAEYAVPLADNRTWFTQLDVNFTDDFFMTGDLDPIDEQSGFQKVNFRTGIRADNWMVMAFGRNITDKLTASGAADVPLALGSHFQYRARGEVWGLQVSYEF